MIGFSIVQIEGMCRSTQASAVPVIPDSEGYRPLLYQLS